MVDDTRVTPIYTENGGARQVIASGGSLDVESGGTIEIESGGTFNTKGRQTVASGASLDVESGGEIDIESGGSLKIAGTAITATAAELNEYSINIYMADVSTADSAWGVAQHAGTITKIESVIDGAITTADAVITPQIATVNITDGGITIANAGSAAGDVDSSTPSAANVVTAGQAIEIATDGASTNTVAANFTITISRT